MTSSNIELSHPAFARLRALMRQQLSGKSPDSTLFEGLGEREWTDLFDLAYRQRVLAVAYDGLCASALEAALPRMIRLRWALSAEKVGARSAHREKTTRELAELFSGRGIRTMVFKGPALSRYYPNPGHREFGDLDIYLFGDYEKGNRMIESAGIEVDYHDPKNSLFIFNGIPVENHHSFTYRKNGSDRRLESYFAEHLQNAVPMDGYYVPTPGFDMLYLLHHASRHFLLGGFTMRTVVDWGAFLNAERGSLDTGHIGTMLDSTSLVRFHDAMTSAAEDITGHDFSSLIFGKAREEDKTMVLDQMLSPVKEYTEGGARLSDRIGDVLRSRPRYRIVPYRFYRDRVLGALRNRVSGH